MLNFVISSINEVSQIRLNFMAVQVITQNLTPIKKDL